MNRAHKAVGVHSTRVLCVCVYTYIHTYIHTNILTCIHAYKHTYIHTYIHTDRQTYRHAYTHISLLVIYVYMLECMYVCIKYADVSVCIYVYVLTHLGRQINRARK